MIKNRYNSIDYSFARSRFIRFSKTLKRKSDRIRKIKSIFNI